jgi:hypothetical protein
MTQATVSDPTVKKQSIASAESPEVQQTPLKDPAPIELAEDQKVASG